MTFKITGIQKAQNVMKPQNLMTLALQFHPTPCIDFKRCISDPIDSFHPCCYHNSSEKDGLTALSALFLTFLAISGLLLLNFDPVCLGSGRDRGRLDTKWYNIYNFPFLYQLYQFCILDSSFLVEQRIFSFSITY